MVFVTQVRCPRCKDVFEHPNLLKMHIKVSHLEPVCMVCGVKFDHDKLLKLHMQHYHKVGEYGNKKKLLAFGKDLLVNHDKQSVEQQFVHWTNGRLNEGNDLMVSETFLTGSMENSSDANVFQEKQDQRKQLPMKQQSTYGTYEEHDADLRTENNSDKECRRYSESSFSPLEGKQRRDGRSVSCGAWNSDEKGFVFTRGTEKREAVASECENQSLHRSHGYTFVHQIEKETHLKCNRSEFCRKSFVKEGQETNYVSNYSSDTHSFRNRPSDTEGSEKSENQLQLSRPSVITSNVSFFKKIPKCSEKQLQERESFFESDRCSEKSESCLGTDDDAFDSSSESDSSSAGDNKQFTKHGLPHCNRCRQIFSSKMEYLHHLIAHQREDKMNVCYPQFGEQEEKHVKDLMNDLRGSHLHSPTQNLDRMTETSENPLTQLHNLSLVDRPQKSQGIAFEEFNTLKLSPSHLNLRQKEIQSSDEVYPKNLSCGKVACSECNEIFTDVFSCKVHIEKKHFQLKCKECGLKFDHRKLLRIHIEAYHSSKEMLKCLECGLSFQERSQFVSHVTLHQQEIRNRKDNSGKEEKLRFSSNNIQGLHQDVGYEREHKPTAKELLEYSKCESESADVQQLASQQYRANQTIQLSAVSTDTQHEKHSNFEVRNSEDIKTRIFIPKFECSQPLLTGADLSPMNTTWYSPLDERGGAPLKKPLKRTRSAPPETCKRVSAIVTTSDSASVATSDNFGTPSREFIGSPYMVALQNSMLKRIKQEFDERSESILNGPPPLIPISKKKPQNDKDENKNQLGDDQFVTSSVKESDTQVQTVKPSVGVPRQKTKLARSFSAPHRDSRIRESIQSATKEALLNTLSLKKRVALLEHNNMLRREDSVSKTAQESTISYSREDVTMENSRVSLNHTNGSTNKKDCNELQEVQRRILNKSFDCHHCGLHFDHKKLLKIHLDAYHGSSTRMSCDLCNLTFIDRDKFLNHLMSHPEDERSFQPRYNRPYVRRKSKTLANGEAIVSRELNPVIQYSEEAERSEKFESKTTDNKQTTSNKVDLILQDGVCLSSKETVTIPEIASSSGDSMILKEYRVPGVVSSEQQFKKGKFKLNLGDQNNECFVCGKVFDSGRRLEVHISSHASLDKDGRYCCSLCNKTFDHHRKLEVHTRSHTGFKPHKCDHCGRCFPYYSSFYYHKMTHTKDKPHKCPLCGKGFIQTRYLRTHLRTHKDWQGNSSGDENVASPCTPLSDNCESTDSPIESPSASAEHQGDAAFEQNENDLEQSTAEILCSFKANCRRREMESSTQNHRLSSSAEDFEQCDVKLDLKNENLTGDGEDLQSQSQQSEKSYHCKLCSKSFSAYSSLYVHNRIHTGQRPYSCKYCGKKFTHASGLKRHVRCHTGERPYPCPICPSAFADRGALRSHIRTHTGERPYKCNWCGKTYTQPSSLKVHKRTLHVEEEMKSKAAKSKID